MRLTYLVYTLRTTAGDYTKVIGPFDNRAIAKRYDVLNRKSLIEEDGLGDFFDGITSCVTSNRPEGVRVFEGEVKKDILFKAFEELGL